MLTVPPAVGSHGPGREGRLEDFVAWLQTSHGQLAGPQEAELLLYAWVAHDNFLPAFGQLRLLQGSMHQIEVFIQQTCQSTPSSTGMIVALHANKPYGMGNIYDHHQSPSAAPSSTLL